MIMRKGGFLLVFMLANIALLAQNEEKTTKVYGGITTRTMGTFNRGELRDYHITVSYANVGVEQRVTPWLSFSAQVNGLLNYGLDGLLRIDPTTNSGPIYEANLWTPVWMDGSTHFELPILSANLNFNEHQIKVGRFLVNTPLINTEGWPFPGAASEGVYYQFKPLEKKFSLQAYALTRIAPRFSARFENIGNSIGRGGLGFEVDGDLSNYLGNVDSDFQLVLNANFEVSEHLSFDLWEFYTDNVMNNFIIEPTISFTSDLRLKLMYLQQHKVNNGGNEDEELTYVVSDQSSYFGARLEKDFGVYSIQLNASRITDQGRLQLPRDWGVEPFYSFQRRTRMEGLQDATEVMVKWQRTWANDEASFRWYASASRGWFPFPGDAEKNKYRTTSSAHLDNAFKFTSKRWVKGLGAELYMAYRFLAEDINGDYRYLINRADFFHIDFLVSYSF